MKKLKLSISRFLFFCIILTISDAATSMIKNIIIAMLTTKWLLYFSFGVGFLDSTTTTVMRSMIISVVPNTEIAKVFCVVELFKGILQLIGPVIYGKLYQYTIESIPEAFLYLGIGVKALVFITGVLIYIELEKRRKMKLCCEYAHKKNDILNKSEENDKINSLDEEESSDDISTEK